MSHSLKIAGLCLLFIMLIAGSYWRAIYNWHDCLAVGHSRLYCVLNFGR